MAFSKRDLFVENCGAEFVRIRMCPVEIKLHEHKETLMKPHIKINFNILRKGLLLKRLKRAEQMQESGVHVLPAEIGARV